MNTVHKTKLVVVDNELGATGSTAVQLLKGQLQVVNMRTECTFAANWDRSKKPI